MSRKINPLKKVRNQGEPFTSKRKDTPSGKPSDDMPADTIGDAVWLPLQPDNKEYFKNLKRERGL